METRDVHLVVIVNVDRNDAEPTSTGVDEPGLGGHVDEPAAVVPEDVVGGCRFHFARVAVKEAAWLFGAERWAYTGRESCSGTRRGRDHHRRRGQRTRRRSGSRGSLPTGRLGHVLESPVAAVVIKGIRPPAGDEQVGKSVVVIIGRGHTVAVTPRKRGDS